MFPPWHRVLGCVTVCVHVCPHLCYLPLSMHAGISCLFKLTVASFIGMDVALASLSHSLSCRQRRSDACSSGSEPDAAAHKGRASSLN